MQLQQGLLELKNCSNGDRGARQRRQRSITHRLHPKESVNVAVCLEDQGLEQLSGLPSPNLGLDPPT